MAEALAKRAARRIVQTAHVARAVRPSHAFLRDIALGRRVGVYTAPRLGARVALRPRGDLQVAREAISKNAYETPGPVAQALGDGPLTILDAGANIGLFAITAARRHPAGSRVIALEPDPDNLPLLRRNIDGNGLGGVVDVRPVAAGTGAGTARFVSGLRENSRLADVTVGGPPAGATVDVAVIDIFDLLATVELAKIDIEGAEWAIMRDPRLATSPVRALVVEWHGWADPSPDPQAEADRLLRAAGFRVLHDYVNGTEGGNIWAWRA